MRSSIIIERKNVSVPGHDGHGRYYLIGKKTVKGRLTENSASRVLGASLISSYLSFCKKKGITPSDKERNLPVRLTIEFEVVTESQEL